MYPLLTPSKTRVIVFRNLCIRSRRSIVRNGRVVVGFCVFEWFELSVLSRDVQFRVNWQHGSIAVSLCVLDECVLVVGSGMRLCV